MVCAPVRSIIPSLKLGDYLSVQAHKPCSISHMSVSEISRVDCAITSVSMNFSRCLNIFGLWETVKYDVFFSF